MLVVNGRTPGEQAWYQFATLIVTLILAIIGGAVGGFITTRDFFEPPNVFFHDDEHWHETGLEEENKKHESD